METLSHCGFKCPPLSVRIVVASFACSNAERHAERMHGFHVRPIDGAPGLSGGDTIGAGISDHVWTLEELVDLLDQKAHGAAA
jgi:hypothetical protein